MGLKSQYLCSGPPFWVDRPHHEDLEIRQFFKKGLKKISFCGYTLRLKAALDSPFLLVMMSAYWPASPVAHSITSRQTWALSWSMLQWESDWWRCLSRRQNMWSVTKRVMDHRYVSFQAVIIFVHALTVHTSCMYIYVKIMLRLWSCNGPCSPRKWSGASLPAPSPPSRPSSRRPWPEGHSRSPQTRLQRLALPSRSQGKQWRWGREPEKMVDLWNLEQTFRLRR